MTSHQKLTPVVHGKAIYNIFRINLDVFFLLLLHCSYDFEDIPTTTQFYTELLKWWSDVAEKFVTERVQRNMQCVE